MLLTHPSPTAALLRNFLSALPLASLTPSRILLQTGAKNYGVHLGRARTPFLESDPRVALQPNFYYPQEDLLFDYCKSHPGTSWNISKSDLLILPKACLPNPSFFNLLFHLPFHLQVTYSFANTPVQSARRGSLVPSTTPP